MARRQHRINQERLNMDAIISYQAQTENPERDEEGLDLAQIGSDAAWLVLLASSVTVLLVAGTAVIR
jgi:hypothetical protein